MNLLDYAVLGVFVLFLLLGFYKGFLNTLFSICAFILCWLLSLLLMPLGANAVRGDARLYDMMLYYTEGSEYIANSAGMESVRLPISQLSADDLNAIVSQADVPYPMDKEIVENVAKEAFSDHGITTLGDYFNETMVRVFINILSFLAIFVLLRLICAFFINGVDYAWRFPMLRMGDALLGGALGVLRGVLALFLIFMLMPVLLTVVGQFDLVTDVVEGSFFAPFFYYSNFLLSMMPGV
ncbi:MAG: CvpA family protein [Clostridia bacterium]|nr:CvpA family protein [Clostridia bacterium]